MMQILSCQAFSKRKQLRKFTSFGVPAYQVDAESSYGIGAHLTRFFTKILFVQIFQNSLNRLRKKYMNLNNNPTKDQLKALFHAADDEAGHHIMWIDAAGDVRVTLLPEDMSPVHWEDNYPTTRFRFETFCAGNGYVGPDAANDEEHVTRYFNWLKRTWVERNENGKAQFVD
jgi:hypothetical protein